tara:strand:+ start:311 stop:595 length:285 start_codon:yes stop_codon:yes gene_type:complete
MTFKPIYIFRGTNIKRAFIINAFLAAIIAAFTVEIRRIVDEHRYTKMLPDRPHKIAVTLVFSFLIGISAYTLLRVLFGTGESMMEGKMLKYFWK